MLVWITCIGNILCMTLFNVASSHKKCSEVLMIHKVVRGGQTNTDLDFCDLLDTCWLSSVTCTLVS